MQHARLILRSVWIGLIVAGAVGAAEPAAKVPGVVIHHQPASSGIYVGSPSIAILPDGTYVASHDEFGPKSKEHKSAISHVYRSADRGQTWARVSTIDGAFWSSLFVHKGALYLFGPRHHYGDIVIRKSGDGGKTWTDPKDAKSGLIAPGRFHCAPMPVLVHDGRLWRAFEDCDPVGRWGHHFKAMMLSAAVDADLLDAASWTLSTRVARDENWLGKTFSGFLEGNAVAAPDGQIVDILRVDTPLQEYAAVVRISADGKTASFDGEKGFVPFSGGAKKFAIRFDPQSKLYWSLVNHVPPHLEGRRPAGVRNTLALAASSDLKKWEVRCVVLYHPDVTKHAFQYVDWLFDGPDMVVASRTAYDDGEGGAHNAHDANYLTFHRIANFRELTMKDSAPMPEKAPVSHNTAELEISGFSFSIAKLEDKAKAFSNRNYVWENVPAGFKGWSITQTAGGEAAVIRVKAKADTTLHVMTTPAQKALDLSGWTKVDNATFSYTDTGHTKMDVYVRPLKAGEAMMLPQGNWTGVILLFR